MNHDEIKNSLQEFRDGELSPALQREIAVHLKACAGCVGLLQRWERIASSLMKGRETPPSEVFVAKVLRRVKEQATPAARGSWALRWLAPGFAAVAAAFMLTRAPSVEEVSIESILLEDDDVSVIAGEEPADEDVLGFMEAP